MDGLLPLSHNKPQPKIAIIFARAFTLQQYTMGGRDDWSAIPDGSDFDGEQLPTLVRSDSSPFLWKEIEEISTPQVTYIPTANKGFNNYVNSGFKIILMRFHAETEGWRRSGHIKLSNGSDIVARLARGDVNMPNIFRLPNCYANPRSQVRGSGIQVLTHRA